MNNNIIQVVDDILYNIITLIITKKNSDKLVVNLLQLNFVNSNFIYSKSNFSSAPRFLIILLFLDNMNFKFEIELSGRFPQLQVNLLRLCSEKINKQLVIR